MVYKRIIGLYLFHDCDKLRVRSVVAFIDLYPIHIYLSQILYTEYKRQEQQEHNKARHKKIQRESHSVTLVTTHTHTTNKIIYIIACEPLRQHQQTVSSHYISSCSRLANAVCERSVERVICDLIILFIRYGQRTVLRRCSYTELYYGHNSCSNNISI